MKRPAIYIVTNRKDGVLYIGVTSNLPQRAYQHKEGLVEGFGKRYRCQQLVYAEFHDTMEQAITQEKKLKNLPRAKKIAIIERDNPQWQDLYETLAM